MRAPWRRVVSALLVGLIVGAAGGALWQRHAYREYWRQPPSPQKVLDRLTKELSLDADQRKAVETILTQRRADVESLHDKTKAEFDKVRATTREDINKLLRPEQQKKFAELTARWEEKHKRWLGEEGPPTR